MTLHKPSLHLRYSQDFELDIESSAQISYDGAAAPDWLSRIKCIIRHPTGRFLYEADRICFARSDIERFSTELRNIRNGSSDQARLATPGEMFSFLLHLQNRQLKATIAVREFQPENELTILTAGFTVDYDLFINRLYDDVFAFARDLKDAELPG